MGSNTTYDIPVTVSGVNAASVSLINDDADGRTFDLVSTVPSDEAKIYGSADGINFPPPLNTTPLLTLGGNSPPKTIQDRSLKYRAVFSGSGVRSLKVRAGTGCCAGDAGQHFNTLALGDFPAGGVVTTQANVDQFAAFTIAQVTNPGQILTFPAPSDPTPTYVRWVSNVGTQDFVLYGLLVIPGSATKIVWNGSAWVEGCVGTSTPTRSVLGAGGKNLLDSNGVATVFGNSQALVAGSQLDLLAGNGGGQWIVDGTGNLLLDVIGTGEVRIGTGLQTKTVRIGNAFGASAVSVVTGTAGFGLQTTGGGPIGINSSNGPIGINSGTGTTDIDSTTGAISIGAGPTVKTLTLGSTAGASASALRAGTGGLTIINNGATWTWPTVLGAAGTKLTDAAGNGILSFA